jgi:hypothetical protein
VLSLLRINPHRPLSRFLLVFLIPVLTALSSFAIVLSLPDCGIDEPAWELGHMRLAFLPGVLNLVPILWLLSRAPRVKQAAGVAGIMGGAQFLLPQAAIAYYAAVPGAGGQGVNAACSVSSFLLLWLVTGMIILWLVCVILGVAVLHSMAR